MRTPQNQEDHRSPPNERFRKTQRLRRRVEFANVFAQRCVAADVRFAVHVSGNGLPLSRLGVVVPRRVGCAVQRNTIRRRIRDAFRRAVQELPDGYDIICIAKPEARMTARDLRKGFCALVTRAVRKHERRRRRNGPQN